MKILALTRRYSSVAPAIITPIYLSAPGQEPLCVMALWDTGATMSAVDYSVISKLSLPTCEFTAVKGINSSLQSFRVYADVRLTEKSEPIQIMPCAVRQIYSAPDVHVIIGMDIISKGNFSISNAGGETVFSFMIPSAPVIDFAQQIRDARRQ